MTPNAHLLSPGEAERERVGRGPLGPSTAQAFPGYSTNRRRSPLYAAALSLPSPSLRCARVRGAASPLPRRSREGEGRERAARTIGRSSLFASPAAGVEDRQANAIAVRQHLAIPETQHAKTRPLNMRRPTLVVGDLVCVLAAIDLDHEGGLDAQEVQEVRPPGNLPLPFPAAEPAGTQGVPEPSLGPRVFSPKFARPLDPEGSDLPHAADVNICGTSSQAPTSEPPSPYPLPLSLRSGERTRISSPPAKRRGRGRERAARRLRIASGAPA